MHSTMKNWQLKQFGAHKLSLHEQVMPAPGAGEVLVQVEAVSLNYRDKLMIDNGMGMTINMPFTPASDMCGTVMAIGPGVSRWQKGDRVISTFWAGWTDGVCPAGTFALGGTGPGMLASHVVLSEQWLVAAPTSLSAAEASTLPCAGLTAWFALVETGALHAGQTVLVHGTGGVALFGVQIARAHGAQVIVVSGSDDKLAKARSLGATHGVNRMSNEDWVSSVRVLTNGRGADHVLEIVGGANLGRSLQALAQGGRVSVIGTLESVEVSSSVFPLIMNRPSVQGIGVGHRRALEDLVRAVDVIALKPVIAAEYDYTQLPAALAHLDRGPYGKIVLKF
jgi:NADPH:quinone reductase-like Zn-dependent oxidoreductase